MLKTKFYKATIELDPDHLLQARRALNKIKNDNRKYRKPGDRKKTE